MTVFTNIIKSGFQYFWKRADTWASLTGSWESYGFIGENWTNVQES